MFAEIKDYREHLEIAHLRTKNHIALAILLILAIATITYMALTGVPLKTTMSVSFWYFIVVVMNIATLAYGRENIRFYELNKYMTTFGVYTIALMIIFVNQTAATIAALFIAYAISAFYQDMKIMLVSNILLMFSTVTLMINYPGYFNFPTGAFADNFGVAFFIIIFISLLTISSYIIVKQKRFFYNQLALSKETETRNIDLLNDLQEKVTGKTLDIEAYYRNVLAFSEAFCKKIETENGFKPIIEAMLLLEKGMTKQELLKNRPEFSEADVNRFADMLLSNRGKLAKISVMLSQTANVHVKKREIFSETQFKSFNHPTDNLEIKILAFAVFYSVLRSGNSFLAPLSDEQIRNVLIETDYFYYNDPRIMKAFAENGDVFRDIAASLGRKGNGR